MKKMLSVLLIFSILLPLCVAFGTPPVSAVTYGYTKGDSDDSTRVNTKDILLLRKYLGGIVSKKDISFLAADTDEDNVLTTKDILYVRKLLGGIIDLEGNNTDNKYKIDTITVDNKNIGRYTIVIDDEASDSMSTASLLLKKYINAACGISLNITTEALPVDTYRIRMLFDKENDFDLGSENYIITVTENSDIFMHCGTHKASVSAAYFFLEEFIGYKFLFENVEERLENESDNISSTAMELKKSESINIPYTGHIHSYLDATCISPAKCYCGETTGNKTEHTYVTGECTVCNDYNESYCPKLYFEGNMSAMYDKKDVRNITFEYRSKQQILTGAAKIKVQGTSSLAYDKKNYTINFYDDSSYSDKMGVDVGWGEQDKYCLKANWIDKTHSRNVVTAQLAGEIQKKYGLFNTSPNNGAIDGFPVEIYINGEFHGLYTMNIPKDAWMFDMDENNSDHIVICGESWTDEVLFKEIPTDFSSWGIEVGIENDETLKKIQRLVAFIRNSSDEEFKKDFSQYLNLDAALNYYVMINFGWMPDNTGKNMLMATYDGKVWYPSLYDLDTTWGTNWKGDGLYNYKNKLLSTSNNLLWERMEKLFKKEIAERYFELRSTILDTNYVMTKFNSFYSLIPEEVLQRESAKWDTEKNPIPGYPISQIQDYLESVISRFDEKYSQWK